MNQGETPASDGPPAPLWSPTVLPGVSRVPQQQHSDGAGPQAHPTAPPAPYASAPGPHAQRQFGPAPVPQQFGAAPGPFPQQFGATSGPHAQPQYAPAPYGRPQPQFGQPQFGQPQFGQPQFGQPQFGRPPHGRPQYAIPRQGRPAWAVALIAIPLVLVVVGVLAAVAVPVFQSQHSKADWAARTLAMPDTLLGLPRQPDLEDAQLRRIGPAMPAGTEFGVYAADAGPAVVVIAVRSTGPQSTAAQVVNWHSVQKQLQASLPGGLELVERDPGPFGGRFACGSNAQVALCMAADVAVTMAVIGGGGLPGGVEAVASARAEIERIAT